LFAGARDQEGINVWVAFARGKGCDAVSWCFSALGWGSREGGSEFLLWAKFLVLFARCGVCIYRRGLRGFFYYLILRRSYVRISKALFLPCGLVSCLFLSVYPQIPTAILGPYNNVI
jgi:hypothetical protein